MKLARLALCALFLGGAAPSALPAGGQPARGRAAHIVLMVWDGMRADFVTRELTPNLWQLAERGVLFRRHHSIYPTLTNVNAAALATGVFPGRSGAIGNYEFRAEIDRAKFFRTDAVAAMRLGDGATRGKFLALPTIPEMVQARGGRTAVAGTKSAPFLFDRRLAGRAAGSITVCEGEAIPASAMRAITRAVGNFPTEETFPCTAQDEWTTRALTEALWRKGVPEFSVLWLGDPDRSEHQATPGSPTALAAIKSADDQLARVLRALEAKGVREETDLFVVSDHGFSTIERAVDIASLLQADGFQVAGKEAEARREGAIRVVGNGGTVFFYVREHEPETTRRLAQWLQSKDFSGVIFSRAAVEGTFPLARVHLEKPAGPDVVLSLRWNEGRNAHGTAGLIVTHGSGKVPATHGTLSPFDTHNICVAAGPDFRRGWQSEVPSSNLDVAASIAHLLGLKPPQKLDGRVLTEALAGGDVPVSSETTEEAVTPAWRQYLRVSKVGATEYFEEGNGRQWSANE